jgi:hypothetical protein
METKEMAFEKGGKLRKKERMYGMAEGGGSERNFI